MVFALLTAPLDAIAQQLPAWATESLKGYGLNDPLALERALRQQQGQVQPTVLDQTSQDPLDAMARENAQPGQVPGNLGSGQVLPPSPLEKDYSARLGAELPELPHPDPAELQALQLQRQQAQPGQPVPPMPLPDRSRPPKRETLQQFGYDLLQGQWQPNLLPSGGVPDDYPLGIGDRLVVSLRGTTSSTQEVSINRDGQVILPELAPVTAAGQTLGEFRQALQNEINQHLVNTQAFVSLGQVRSVRILVSGAVNNPGMKQLLSTSTVLEALTVANGVKKTGSLRRIVLLRNGKQQMVDLYSVFIDAELGGGGGTILQDGDRIIVPPLGPTVAVAGDVQRPGIYELAADAGIVSRDVALQYAGGPLRKRGNRFLRYRLGEQGEDAVQPLEAGSRGTLEASDILLVRSKDAGMQGTATLDGQVFAPGTRALGSGGTVRQLVGSLQQLQADSYVLMAALVRRDEASGQTVILPVPLQGILTGTKPDMRLQRQDRLVVFSRDDVRYLWSADVMSLLMGQLPPTLQQQVQVQAPAGTPTPPAAQQPTRIDPSFPSAALVARNNDKFGVLSTPACAGLRSLMHVAKLQSGERFAGVMRALATRETVATDQPELLSYESCPAVFEQDADLLPFLLDHVVGVTGAVRVPGAYPVAPDTDIRDVLKATGGLLDGADAANVVLTRLVADPLQNGLQAQRVSVDLSRTGTRAPVRPGNMVSVATKANNLAQGVIRLEGEFRNPGLYTITSNETLSSVIARAGGLTEEAYPYGAVFTRVSLQNIEKQSYDRVARQLQSALTSNLGQLASGNDSRAMAVTQSVNGMVENLRSTPALGRMVVEADPAMLVARPNMDPLLEPGDRLFMPKRPSFVMVSGDVLNPGAQMFNPGYDAEDYLESAGGFQKSADEDKVFVVLPNGEAKPLSLSFWNYKSEPIPPGSMIVVPSDPLPLGWLNSLTQFGGVFSQLAISAASLAVINRQ